MIFRFDSKEYKFKPGVPALNDVPADFLRQAELEGLPKMKRPTEEERQVIQTEIQRVWGMIGKTFQKYTYNVCGLYLFDDEAYDYEVWHISGK